MGRVGKRMSRILKTALGAQPVGRFGEPIGGDPELVPADLTDDTKDVVNMHVARARKDVRSLRRRLRRGGPR